MAFLLTYLYLFGNFAKTKSGGMKNENKKVRTS